MRGAIRRASIWHDCIRRSETPHAVDHIRYDLLAQEALRGVVRNVLTDAAKNGLPGEHHFFITFDTTRRRRAPVDAAARAISGGDDHRPAAPVLGSDGDRRGVRGRPVVRRRAGAAGRAVRGDQGLRRSVGAVRAAIREVVEGAGRATPTPAESADKPRRQRAARAGRAQRRRRAAEPDAASAPRDLPAAGRCREPRRAEPDKPSGGGEVVRLDRFRKK